MAKQEEENPDRINAELAAISLWDRLYESSPNHAAMEAHAFQARQVRKLELMQALGHIQEEKQAETEVVAPGSGLAQSAAHDASLLAHNILNKLTVALGRLDLLNDIAPADSEIGRNLGIFRMALREMADQIQDYQRRHAASLADPKLPITR